MRRLLALLVLLLPVGPAFAQSSVVKTDNVRAELIAEVAEVKAGEPFWVALRQTLQPHWHTYWKNPGDSGLPTSLQWQLPADLIAGAIDWPRPQKLPAGPLINYGYEGRLLLPVPVKVQAVPAGARGVDVKLHAEWLVCKET